MATHISPVVLRQDRSEVVEPARLRFAHLRSLALAPDESATLIELRSAVNLTGSRWRKSSFSGGEGGGNCVEAALTGPTTAVRDSKNADGQVLVLPAAAWATLLTQV